MPIRLFIIIACSLFTLSTISLNATQVVINGDLTKYQFVYVIPTTGVTSSSGGGGYVFGNQYGVFGTTSTGATVTINPSELVAGQMMRMGFTILPQITPEFKENTLIASYGYIEGSPRDDFHYASATIMLQFRDAMTQELVASFEAIGYGNNDAESIKDAIYAAIQLYQYSLNPRIEVKFVDVYKRNISMDLTNYTPYVVNAVVLHLSYYLGEELIYEQEVTVNNQMATNETVRTKIKRDKQAQSWDMKIRATIISWY